MHKIQNKSKTYNKYEARNARYKRSACLEFQIILSLEFVSDFVFLISYFTFKYFAKKSGAGLAT
ncbi:MAG: hypothetical protein CV080_03180 [Candidatus Kuenenia stuttgartiensis]|uniref:Uncharacterized protein n=1 Tax=Kuenenia stuttgartiensis TaxID=174633 RepID=Q1PZ58_KUEST|nr:MAG: hypothetical protein CV080_03180 [Candidatus Kuenenia stuttgartiensis]CAJ72374.1 unknown protein [Candidatus Kuenenia stuttgartiensis]